MAMFFEQAKQIGFCSIIKTTKERDALQFNIPSFSLELFQSLFLSSNAVSNLIYSQVPN